MSSAARPVSGSRVKSAGSKRARSPAAAANANRPAASSPVSASLPTPKRQAVRRSQPQLKPQPQSAEDASYVRALREGTPTAVPCSDFALRYGKRSPQPNIQLTASDRVVRERLIALFRAAAAWVRWEEHLDATCSEEEVLFIDGILARAANMLNGYGHRNDTDTDSEEEGVGDPARLRAEAARGWELTIWKEHPMSLYWPM